MLMEHERNKRRTPHDAQQQVRRTRPAQQGTSRASAQRRSPETAQSERTAERPQRAEQPRRKVARTSRAAQEAQRRRDERRERDRLDGLREKQVRKAKHRTPKRINAEVWKRLLIMLGVVAALVLSMVIFFRVRHLEVEGGNYYTSEEILEASGVAQGDNLLTVQRGQIAGNVMAALPYVRSVQVARQLPDTLVIHVTEFDATYCVRDEAGGWYLMTAGGKATEQLTEQSAKTHIQLTGLTIKTPTLGEEVTVSAEAGKESAASLQLAAAKKLLEELENAELTKEITSVNVPSSYNLSVQYGDRFLVELGGSDQLDYKLEFLKIVVAEQKSYATGTIDLTLKSGNEARVTLNE